MNIRKIGFLIAGLLVICPIKAQYRVMDSEVYVGVSGGATMSTATLVPMYSDKSYHFAGNGGISFRYIAEKNFGIEADINYFQTGWEDDYGYQSTDSYRRSLTYIEIPFLMHAYVGDKNVRGFLNVGPKVAWFLNESESIQSSYTSAELPYYGKPVENYLQWGIMGGAGLEIHLQRLVLGLEGRYYYGLSDIFQNAVTDDFVTSNLQQISLNFFCLFQIK